MPPRLYRERESLKTENLQEIKSASDSLNQIWSESASSMYQQAGAAGGDAAPGSTSESASAESKDEKVEEADYEVVDDDKNDKKDKN